MPTTDPLDDFDISAEQKQAVLGALWHIMSIMVDIGFGMDTVQFVLHDIFEKASRDSEKLIEKKDAENSIVSAPVSNRENCDA